MILCIFIDRDGDVCMDYICGHCLDRGSWWMKVGGNILVTEPVCAWCRWSK